ncbi:MAG: septum formation family protein [Acidimicrobiales bacterium]
MKRRGLLAVVVVVLAACAPGGLGAGEEEQAATTTTVDETTTTESETTTTTESDTTTTRSGPPPEPPKAGECRGPISIADISAATDSRPTVPCDQPHGTETATVHDLPEQWDYNQVREALETGGEPRLENLLSDCSADVQDYVGSPVVEPESAAEVNPHQLELSYFVPTRDEWERGARWLRCDVTLYPPEGADEDAPAGTTVAFAGAAAQPVIDPSFRQCSTLPAADDLPDVPCTEPHVRELMLVVLDTDLDPTSVLRQNEWSDLAGPAAHAHCGAALPSRVGAERPDIVAQEWVPRLDMAIEEYEFFGTVTYECWAVTSVPITGTVQAIGSNPLPAS